VSSVPHLDDAFPVSKDEFGVELICLMLTEHGIKIALSTYYDKMSRKPSKRALRDAQIMEEPARSTARRTSRSFPARGTNESRFGRSPHTAI
jgi:hypothetical protein